MGRAASARLLAFGLVAGCTVDGDGGTSFDTAQSSLEVTSVTQTGGDTDSTGATGGGGSVTAGGSTSGATAATDSGTTAGGTGASSDSASGTATGGASAGSTSGATATTGSTGGGGPACANPGDLVVQGATGPANANQNCPVTSFPIQVAGGAGPITDVELLFTADVATTSEFTLTLRSPAQSSVVMFDKHGGTFSDDFVNTLFDDGAASPIATAPAPRTGCFSPDAALSAFNGQTADGTWNLDVQTCLFAVTIQQAELRLSF